MAAGQGASGRDPVRGLRRAADPHPADAAWGRHSLSGVPDDALFPVHTGAHRHVAPGRGARRSDGAVQQGRTLMFDLIVRGGTLADGRIADIGITGDTIAAVEDLAGAEAGLVKIGRAS